MHPDVLITGAGPTGLTLACELARRGVPALLVERAPALFPGSRGKGLQPRTLEIFEDLGVLAEIRAAGRRYPAMLPWTDGRPGEPFALIPTATATEQVPHPETWMVPQWRTQEILYDRLRELGGDVRFGAELTGFTQDDTGVTAEITGIGTVTARYLVAADGGRSTVRRTLGIPMTGETVDPRPSLVADLRLTGLDREHWHVFPQAPGGPLALCPMPGTDDFQLYAQYEDGEPDTSPDGVRAVVAARTHLGPDAVTEIRWASDFRPRAALAERFRTGRVLLAGDAAHVHSPAGGQGLNTSVQDAYNLGWKLAHLLRHGADAELLLDSYQAERLPVAADVLDISTSIHRAGPLAGQPGTDRRRARRGKDTDQLAVGYRGGPLSVDHREAVPEDALQAGDRAPDAHLPDGTRLFDVLRGTHATLVTTATEPPAVPAGVRALRHDAYGPATDHPTLYLIRPDGYLGLVTRNAADLAPYLALLGLSD
ncbi:FAD-dependent monooxygenase [Kitasatospora sp. NPDC088783]|uniref:FAD-dependent monooxygenase n=1 Tax=Kitasatospora sp. NPDC088783 TaxID=3364077 RepID=UPI00380D923A